MEGGEGRGEGRAGCGIECQCLCLGVECGSGHGSSCMYSQATTEVAGGREVVGAERPTGQLEKEQGWAEGAERGRGAERERGPGAESREMW